MDRAVGDEVPSAYHFICAKFKAFENATCNYLKAHQRQKSCASSRNHDVFFQVGEDVLFSTQNLRLKSRGARKLLPKFIGPFVVFVRVGDCI